jgi:hypothetical protein
MKKITISQIDSMIKYLKSKTVNRNKSRFGNEHPECEDEDSSILGDKLYPGKYVAIGHGKCLSIEDLVAMSDYGKFLRNDRRNLINPFTRQEYSQVIIDKINDLLRLAGKPVIGNGIIPNISGGQLSREELIDAVVDIGITRYGVDISHVLTNYPDVVSYSDGVLSFDINGIWVNATDLGPDDYEYLGIPV